MANDNTADDGSSTESDYEHDRYTKLTTKVKRGEGTRDQDTTKVVTRHPDPEVAVERHHQAILAAKDFANDARRMQPGGEVRYLVAEYEDAHDEEPIDSYPVETLTEAAEHASRIAKEHTRGGPGLEVGEAGNDELFEIFPIEGYGTVVISEVQ